MNCSICNAHIQDILKVKDLNYGGDEEFDYLLCPNCHCLQIAKIPSNMGKYYGAKYYSLNMQNSSSARGGGPWRAHNKIFS